DQVKGDVELARLELEIAERRAALNENTFEDNQKLAELRAKVLETETVFFEQQRRRLTEEASLIRQITKARLEKVKLERDAEAALNTFILQDSINVNKKILQDDESALDERLDAISDNQEAQLRIFEIARDKELEELKQSSIDRVELSSETLAAIYDNEELTTQQKIELDRKAREEQLQNDQTYLDRTLKIQKEFESKSRDLLEESKKLAEENVFKVLQRDAEIFSAMYNTSVNDQLRAINDAFVSGDIKSIED